MADNKGIWCIAENRRGQIASTVFELITAARKIADARGEEVTAVLLGGSGTKAQADAIAARGADRVLVIEHDKLGNFVDEAYAAAINDASAAQPPRTLLIPASVFGRSLAPRLAVAWGAGIVSDVIDLEIDDQKRLVASRNCYAGNVIAKVLVKSAIEIATLRPLAFARSGENGKKGEVVDAQIDPSSWKVQAEFVNFNADESTEIDMSTAEKIVSGGRGLGNADGFKIIRQLAKTLGAAVAASRAAVDADWIPYKHQVGLTGRSVSPRLYFACGISGQIQHLAGMNSSDTIIAINNDADCPMMKMATYAVKGDLHKILPALVSEIEKARGGASAPNGTG